MSAPLAMNTKDGTCWTRRTVTSGGIALYAPESVKTCPEFVMATEAELAEHGIVGSAFALPMPVAPESEPEPEDGPQTFHLVGVVTADDYEEAVYAAEQAESGMEGQGYKGSVWVQADDGEAEKLRARVAELEALLRQATEFRLWEPGYGLYIRRAPGAAGFGVLEARRTDKGRRCWTTSGWQYSAVLTDTELFCWPDASTAVTEARRVMPGAVVREVIAEAQHAHNTAPGPGADDVVPQVTKLRAVLAEDPARCLKVHPFSPRDGWRIICANCDHIRYAPCHGGGDR